MEEADEEIAISAPQGTQQATEEAETAAAPKEEAAPKLKELMSPAEAKEVMANPAFMDFLNDSSRVMERALDADTYDFMVDYTAADSQAKETDGISLNTTFIDERWSAQRAVTDIVMHPTHPEAFFASYNARADGSTQDPDGVVLLWSAAMRQRPGQ